MDEKPRIKKRRKVSYLPSIISIALVLFMLGLFGILLINGNKLSIQLKENFQITVFFRGDSKEEDQQKVYKILSQSAYSKTARFVNSEEAAQTFSREIGQDFVNFLGFNPLLPSVELHLKSEYANAEAIAKIESEIKRYPEVQEIVYQKILIDEINKNIQLLSMILIGLSLIFLVVTITLINNTIRLNLYAQRFIIKSMQMVGATHWFITRPFMLRSLLHGLYGGVLACLLLVSVLYSVPRWLDGIEKLYDTTQFGLLFGVIILAGVLITMISSMISTNHYLRMKIDDLY
jgi:cell division transport system permease protein